MENYKGGKPVKQLIKYPAGLKLCLGLCILILVPGCGSARRSEPLRGPLAMNEQVQRGQMVFMDNCHKCHPGGEAGAGPAINNIPLTRGMLKFRVRSRAFFLGIGRMPSFKKHEISKEELSDLVRYIKVLKKHDEDTPTDGRL